MSYEVHPIFLHTPHNGDAVSYDLRTVMVDAGGQVATRLAYRPATDERDNILHQLVPSQRGLRPEIVLVFDCVTNSDQAPLAAIVTALLHPRDGVVTLSLDGGGIYRTVLLRDLRGPAALGGKTIVGARYELRLEARGLLDEWPEIAGMANGGTW